MLSEQAASQCRTAAKSLLGPSGGLRPVRPLKRAKIERQVPCHAIQTASANTGQKKRQAPDHRSGSPTEKADHELFDEVKFSVRSGKGGRGEIVKEGKGRTVPNFKYRAGGRQPKNIWLPAGDPAPGQNGGDVLITVDESLDNLLHLHKRSAYRAKDGSNGNQLLGSQGSLRPRSRSMSRAEPLRLAVPPGTVVKTKKGTLLGELLYPGQSLVVARGGRGGQGVQTPSGQPPKSRPTRRQAKTADFEEYELEDSNYGLDADGLPGEEVSLHLLLRVVADIGIVGLPNAGKSSLLASLTRASPEIASYPFTTLMPNLGVLKGKELFEAEEADLEDPTVGRRATLADLPGLIEGAHSGRGLGRMFLRHLRRTRAILHVIDASAEDPSADYWVVREELRMYNPLYCWKPHVVALNKMDLEDAYNLEEELKSDLMAMAENLKKGSEDSEYSLPQSVVMTSAMDGRGLKELSRALCQTAASQPS